MNGVSTETVRWKIFFSGRVQHIGFRYTAFYLAKELYLTGWVDNLPDGRVELEVQGPASQIRKFILKLKSQAHIHIERMEIENISPVPYDRRFEVRGYG
ncbi:MAG: acylphosphatase [Clostridiales bacterium]|nr:acylphosphatase [Clostridiales bacterium]